VAACPADRRRSSLQSRRPLAPGTRPSRVAARRCSRSRRAGSGLVGFGAAAGSRMGREGFVRQPVLRSANRPWHDRRMRHMRFGGIPGTSGSRVCERGGERGCSRMKAPAHAAEGRLEGAVAGLAAGTSAARRAPNASTTVTVPSSRKTRAASRVAARSSAHCARRPAVRRFGRPSLSGGAPGAYSTAGIRPRGCG
jgi:hypothetical protein